MAKECNPAGKINGGASCLEPPFLPGDQNVIAELAKNRRRKNQNRAREREGRSTGPTAGGKKFRR
jgi:hypothetical protein